MKLHATPGLVFQFLRQTAPALCRPDAPSLDRLLMVEPERILRWIRDQEPIDEYHLVKALKIFETDRDVYDFLCTL